MAYAILTHMPIVNAKWMRYLYSGLYCCLDSNRQEPNWSCGYCCNTQWWLFNAESCQGSVLLRNTRCQ